MTTAERPDGYTATAKLLHWLIALLVIGLVVVGLYMTRAKLPLASKFQVFQLHKSVGFTVLALMVVRLLWRLTHRPPELPAAMHEWERQAARAAHIVLYLVMFVLPLSGWLVVSASSLPVPTRWFGLFQIPHLAPVAGLAADARKPLEALFKEAHSVLAYLLMLLVVLHVAAALRHHLLQKDDILRRMLPARRSLALIATVALGVAAFLGSHDAPALAQAQGTPRWSVDKAKSEIRFEADAGGQKTGGKLTDYAIELQLDPARPEKVRVAVTFEIAGIKTGTSEIDDALQGAEWFDAKTHPEARFAADKAEKLADGSYRLSGVLAIKGKNVPVAVPFTLAVEGKRARAKAEVTVDRLAFGVGPAGAVMGAVIAREVRIVIVLEAERTDG